ncbi:GDP-mannose-dependent alpha-(1-6)-phosphatidylinositol monomannoside mannosyltransferase [Pelotomaculum sp. FP]|uniref:glycosyltransferase n=1 Tax=Pelotomaculum sp. FP TaxID=261474 RepID=UPI0011052A7A|nr:glycosyltransferase [Pelotomaculum sp. FP]TEB16181.1 GDP-mannose-dependent alpha-(1-6)-phosphatidylinositol monomannoside mannosyltransferase [Pelotomaculum sp. FP]
MRISERYPNYADLPLNSSWYRHKFDEPLTIPVVTIITAYKDHGEYIGQTYQSILSQSFGAWEWLIVDDASDGAHRQIIEHLGESEPRVRLLWCTETKGPAAARNIAVREAKGRYILILDADDLIEPTFIEKCVLVLELHPECTFVNSWIVGFGHQCYLWRRGFEKIAPFYFRNRTVCTALIRKNELLEAGGYPENSIHEDWELWLRLFRQGCMGYTIPEFLIWYRRHAKSRVNRLTLLRRLIYHLEILWKYPPIIRHKHRSLTGGLKDPYDDFRQLLTTGNNLESSMPDQKNLLLIIPWFSMGGADKFNLDLARVLGEKYGYRITFITTLPSKHAWLPEFARITPDIFNLANISQDITDYPSMIRYIINSRKINKVLISNSYLGFQAVPWLKENLPDVDFFAYSHMEEDYWRCGGHPRMAAAIDNYLGKNIVASNHLKNWMQLRGAVPEHIEVCYINVDTDFWREDRNLRTTMRKNMNITDSQVVILLAGRMVPQKRPELALKIISMLQAKTKVSFVFLIVGDGPLLPRLKRLARHRRLNGLVRFIGEVPAEDMLNFYQVADIFFMPSHMEGISLALYEAMATRTVPVGAAVGGQKELVTPECGFLIPQNSCELDSYVEILARLLDNPEEIETFKDNCRFRVESLFRLDQMVEKINEILNNPSKSARLNIGKEFLRMALQTETEHGKITLFAKKIAQRILKL